MAKRFYKSTDGNITVYRATETREYKTAFFQSRQTADGTWEKTGAISFSAQPIIGAKMSIQHLVTEIDEAEYKKLMSLKRLAGLAPERRAHGPQSSWVANTVLMPRGWAEVEA